MLHVRCMTGCSISSNLFLVAQKLANLRTNAALDELQLLLCVDLSYYFDIFGIQPFCLFVIY